MTKAVEILLDSPSAAIYREVVGPLDNNVYFIFDKATSSSVMIDAANEAGLLLERAFQLGCRLVLLTHGHWDHVQAVPDFRGNGYQVLIHEADASMIDGCDGFLKDGQTVEILSFTLRVIHTPGHTPGSVCFWMPELGVLASGDTLFPGGPGATHFPGGSFSDIIASIRDKLFTLPPETLVLPGHGPSTTIGAESPHLEEWIERGW